MGAMGQLVEVLAARESKWARVFSFQRKRIAFVKAQREALRAEVTELGLENTDLRMKLEVARDEWKAATDILLIALVGAQNRLPDTDRDEINRFINGMLARYHAALGQCTICGAGPCRGHAIPADIETRIQECGFVPGDVHKKALADLFAARNSLLTEGQERDALRAEVKRLKDPDTLRNINARDNIERIRDLQATVDETKDRYSAFVLQSAACEDELKAQVVEANQCVRLRERQLAAHKRALEIAVDIAGDRITPAALVRLKVKANGEL